MARRLTRVSAAHHAPSPPRRLRGVGRAENSADSGPPAPNFPSFLLAHAAAPRLPMRTSEPSDSFPAGARSDGSTHPRVPRPRNALGGFWGIFKDETGFVSVFPLSALHCCHHGYPGATAARHPSRPRVLPALPESTEGSTHFIFHAILAAMTATGAAPVPRQHAVPSAGRLMKTNSPALGFNGLGELSQAVFYRARSSWKRDDQKPCQKSGPRRLAGQLRDEGHSSTA